MADKGWIEGCDDEHARNQVLAHYDCEITDQWSNPDFSIYEESTSDGYSVWIATADDKHINVNEDVYYYDGDLPDVLYLVPSVLVVTAFNPTFSFHSLSY